MRAILHMTEFLPGRHELEDFDSRCVEIKGQKRQV